MYQIECEQCEKEFEVYKNRKDTAKFCSNQCEGKYRRKRIEKMCSFCNKKFEILPSQEKLGNGKYCSIDCRGKDKRKSILNKFWNRFEKTENGCWEWKKTFNGKGYGKIKVERKDRSDKVYAHRFSYMIHKGEIPKNKIVCHSCDNRSCVNPNHLWLGTYKDNMQDASNKNRIRKGEESPKAKLSKEDVIHIKKMLKRFDMKQKEIAKKFNVSRGAIKEINIGNNWKHISI